MVECFIEDPEITQLREDCEIAKRMRNDLKIAHFKLEEEFAKVSEKVKS